MSIVTMTEYAKIRKCTFQAIQSAVKSGRISPHHKEGRRVFFDTAVCEEAWLLNTDSLQRDRAHGPQMPGTIPAAGRRKVSRPSSSPGSLKGPWLKFGGLLPPGAFEPEFKAIVEWLRSLPEESRGSAASSVIARINKRFCEMALPAEIEKPVTRIIVALDNAPTGDQFQMTMETVERTVDRALLAMEETKNR
jgi:hypothetical protein